MTTSELVLGRQLTVVDHDEDSVYYDCEIDGNIVTFEGIEGDEGVNVLFTVNGTLARCDLPKLTKLAISRWLLACWADMITKFDSFYCCPVKDEDGDWRAKYYKKMGFVSQGGYMTYTVK